VKQQTFPKESLPIEDSRITSSDSAIERYSNDDDDVVDQAKTSDEKLCNSNCKICGGDECLPDEDGEMRSIDY